MLVCILNDMFLAICKTCGRRELRGPRSIVALVNTAHGAELHFTCRACGAHGAVGAGADVVPLRTASSAVAVA
jgi:hypothetical protein